MAIDRVSQLRDFGVFRDFSWPADLSDFGRYNLIYGWNGTGKTTLSRLFRYLELRRPPPMGQAVLQIGGADVRGEDFPHSNLPIRVFNRDFVQESLFPVGGGDVPPIFVVGRDSVEKQREAERLKAERAAGEGGFNTARSTKQQAERDFDRHCIDRARVIKDTLRSPGHNAYNNYNKTDYQGRAQQMASEGNAGDHRLSDSTRETLLAQHRGTPKRKVAETTYQFPDLQGLANRITELHKSTVMSKAIRALKEDSALAEWTRHGLGLHKDRKSGDCLFCQQQLPADRLSDLEAHFSTEYEKFLQTLDQQIYALEATKQQSIELRFPDRAALYDDLASEYDTAGQLFQQATNTVTAFIDELIRCLSNKKANPFTVVPLNAVPPTVDGGVVIRLNGLIRTHNQACDDFDRRVHAARDSLALDMVAENVEEYLRLRDAVQTATAALPPVEAQLARLSAEIGRLEREIVEHQQPAEELNEDLKRYLGHGDLHLTIKDTGYAISRNGVSADLLSEGEMTALALLYFLKTLEDRSFALRNGVVVLDDPVSSLDQNALFAAFGYIRVKKTQAAAQVIVFTHNFMFFRLVREWFGNLRGVDRRAWQVYMLECEHNGTCRVAKIRAIDQLLMEFESEYHYLFARIYRMATEQPAPTLEAYYSAPSIARRVMETFVAFRVPDLGGHNRLWSQMQTIPFDDVKKSRIYRFLQTHSHRDVVGDGDEDLTLLGESRAVLNDVLAFMRAADDDHVARMIAKVTTPAPGNGV
ncbi:MAG: AAA family ATPase [Phycisphaeraceae bacterium]|nr:AAA family ATPase [Phycisphaeraceae bacterium]